MDPNPGRGMPVSLQRYWLVGKGAAKVRWNVPGDFLRCVRLLTKHFPKDPKGLCNILHTKATGGPPGHGSLEHSALVAAAEVLLAAQPVLGEHLWAGPLAPINKPTGEPGRTRVFEPGAIDHRVLPLPLSFRRHNVAGHQGAVTVGRILGVTTGPDHQGQDWVWAYGDWLDETIIPEVTEAKYLVDQGVAGASLDPGGRVNATVNPETGAEHTTQYVMGGATLVAIPAFDQTRIYNLVEGEWPDDDQDMAMEMAPEEVDCGCDHTSEPISAEYTVNPSGWRGLPLAPREAVFDNDDAVKRITAWAGGGVDTAKMKQAFLWHDPAGNEQDPTSYRLPVGDIISGRLTLVFHAIYAAAALISGAHGGLPDIPDADKNSLRTVISEIYPELAKAFNDSSIAAPWDRPGVVAAREDGMKFAMSTEYAVSESGFPLQPPAAWFADPKLTAKTPLTVTPEGRVYGHLAAWNECHRDVTQNSCVLAPHSKLEYAPFHLGTTFTAEGEPVKTGKIVMDTRHAGINLGYAAAAIHYDNTGDEAATVRAGEDEYGIWVAGAMVPEADARKAAKLRRSPISGDWRSVSGNLELTAALAVNVPAFPVYALDGEEQFALVAAGQVFPDIDDLPQIDEPEFALTEEDDEAQEDRGWELRALIEEDEEYSRWLRARQFAALVTEDGGTPPEVSDTDPIYGLPAMAQRQMDARYTVIEEPEGGGDGSSEPEPTPDNQANVGTGTQPAPAGAGV